MKVQEVMNLVRTHPFRPFRILTPDGIWHDVLTADGAYGSGYDFAFACSEELECVLPGIKWVPFFCIVRFEYVLEPDLRGKEEASGAAV